MFDQESADEKLPASKGVEKRKGRSKKGKPESSDQSCLFSADEANVIEVILFVYINTDKVYVVLK